MRPRRCFRADWVARGTALRVANWRRGGDGRGGRLAPRGDERLGGDQDGEVTMAKKASAVKRPTVQVMYVAGPCSSGMVWVMTKKWPIWPSSLRIGPAMPP